MSCTNIMDADEVFLITNAKARDNPIIYVDDRFLHYTGYEREDFLGKNCRFLQNGQASFASVQLIKEVLSTGSARIFSLVNFKKNGDTFLNVFSVTAFYDPKRVLSYFIARHLELRDIKYTVPRTPLDGSEDSPPKNPSTSPQTR